MTKFLSLTWQADFIPWFELPLHGTVVMEKEDDVAKSLAARVLGMWVSPMLPADGTHLDHATHEQDRQ